MFVERVGLKEGGPDTEDAQVVVRERLLLIFEEGDAALRERWGSVIPALPLSALAASMLSKNLVARIKDKLVAEKAASS